MSYILEVIGFNIESCRIAQVAGANRIELCDNPEDGGTTPSYGFVKAARRLLSIELYPIIRPRGGDFLYSEAEFEIMKSDVQLCKELGSDGVVIGMLNEDGTVDKPRCKQLVDLAYPMGVTFHRAFDRAANPFEALEDVIAIGCERILTSGQKPTATEGSGLIKELITQAEERIIIMPGSGVRSENIIDLAKATGAVQFHTSARFFAESKMKFTIEAMNEKLASVSTNEIEVSKIIELLKNHAIQNKIFETH